jgi:SAM-dependent methyltransferase
MNPPVTDCRICGRPLRREPLIRFAAQPAAAQHFPDRAGLTTDRGTDFDVAECSGCGLVQLTCGPVPYHRDVIRAAAVSPEMMAHRRDQFRRFVLDHGLVGRPVVEIGCGGGEYLQWLADAGADARGLEHDPRAVEACRQRHLQVHEGFVAAAGDRIPGGPFAAFVMLSCLEHLPDANGTLSGIHANLSAGGIGLLEVPNFDMILAERAVGEFMTDHLLYFTARTLETTLRLNGFDVIDVRPTWHDYILTATVRRRGPLDGGGFVAARQAVGTQLHAFLDAFPPRTVAVWGAGHHALATLAMHELAPRIAYVVDSSPAKQDRFTPATHVTVRSPESLRSDPTIRGVIVMGASYSDEIAGMLRRDYPSRLRVAILRAGGLETEATR